MKIYVAHSSSFDFKKELYDPILKSSLIKKHTFHLPHQGTQTNSKIFLEGCNLVIAEVSYPSTGMGIELGWADSFKIPIVCFYKKGTKPSSSLKSITNSIFEYTNSKDLLSKIREVIESSIKNRSRSMVRFILIT